MEEQVEPSKGVGRKVRKRKTEVGAETKEWHRNRERL